LGTYQATIDGLQSAIAEVIDMDPLLDSTPQTLSVQVDADGTTKTYSFSAADSAALGVSTLSLIATAGPTAALAAIDTALERVLGQVGRVGGHQNALQFTSDFIDNTILNKTVQYRDLTDADMALEATNLAAAKIRQDASTAVMAQANSMNRAVADYLLNGALG
jgi:flagellin